MPIYLETMKVALTTLVMKLLLMNLIAATTTVTIHLLPHFLQMFPQLDTLVIPNLRRLPGERACTEIDAAPLPRLRKLILFYDHRCGTITSRFMWPRQWQNVEILLIDILGYDGRTRGLPAELMEQRNLRHVCVIGEIIRRKRPSKDSSKLSMDDSLNQFVKAWGRRDWKTIIFISREFSDGEISLFSAERNDDGRIDYKQLHKKPCRVLLSVFPQFYTLFWQYIYPQLFGYRRFDFM